MNNQGQSLFEVVVALAVITIILFAVVAYAAVAIRNASFSKSKTGSTRLAQEANEWLRGERDTDWTTFKARASGGTGAPWCLDELSWQAGNCGSADFVAGTTFKRETNLIDIDLNTVQAEVKVFWDDPQGYHETKTSTYFTDWKQN